MAQAINTKLFKEAKDYIPGGVNSPVRSFKAVGRDPLFIKKAKGPYLYDETGKKFLDYCLSWGALLLGHANPKIVNAIIKATREGTSFGAVTKLETKLAKLIVEAMPSIEQVRLTSSGTEAVMGAIRVARAYTGKNSIIKFEGSYHGHGDYLLVKSGSGGATFGVSTSLGVPKDYIKHTIVVPYNDLDKLECVIKECRDDLAAIVIEPVLANCGVILPHEGFLKNIRALCDKYNCLLIFDEVITGFRLSFGGAQEFFGVIADLTCLGKIIGGGLPVGAFGGSRKIMKLLAPEGGVYQAGTLSGNPIAVTAGIVTLETLKQDSPYKELENKTKQLCEEIRSIGNKLDINLHVNYIGSLFSLFFADSGIIDSKGAKTQDVALFRKFYNSLLEQGIYFSPSGFEANFLSTKHTIKDIENTVKAVKNSLNSLLNKGEGI